MTPSRPLRRQLRLIVITDHDLAGSRGVQEVVRRALEAGARTIQLRAKEASPRELLRQARGLLELTRPAGALLFVNDRLDVALAAGADGVHLGPDDLPVAAARAAVGSDLLIGFSTDDPSEALRAERHGADYIGCGAVFGTTTKEVGGEAIGLERLHEVARAVSIPVVAIGGITPASARQVARTGAAGVAVVGAVMAAEDPAAAVRELMRPF